MKSAPRQILVIEDSETVLNLVVTYLRDAGYDVSKASDGAVALPLVTAAVEPFDLVLCDVTLPGETGPAVVNEIRHSMPDVLVVFMSGGDMAELAVQEPRARFLPKPFRLAALDRVITEAFSART